MTRADIRTELQAYGFGNSTAEIARQSNWINAAYLWTWFARDPQGVPINWSFARVDQASLAVTAGVQPTMPVDFDDAEWILDPQGNRLSELDPERFDEVFGADNAAGRTGPPVAYKVVNRQVVFGPIPSGSQTMKMTYRRRPSHLDVSGNVVVGMMAAENDSPLWPDHHLILAYHAGLVGGASTYNPFSVSFQGLRDDALNLMRNDLEAEFAPAQTWGDGRWRNVGW